MESRSLSHSCIRKTRDPSPSSVSDNTSSKKCKSTSTSVASAGHGNHAYADDLLLGIDDHELEVEHVHLAADTAVDIDSVSTRENSRVDSLASCSSPTRTCTSVSPSLSSSTPSPSSLPSSSSHLSGNSVPSSIPGVMESEGLSDRDERAAGPVIVDLTSRSRGKTRRTGRPSKSDVWKFFSLKPKDNKPCSLKCLVENCETSIPWKPGWSVGNFANHLKASHKSVYQNTKHFASALQKEKENLTKRGQHTLQSSGGVKYKKTSVQYEECFRSTRKFMYTMRMAPHSIEAEGYKEHMRVLNPQYEPPSRETLRRSIKQDYLLTKENMKRFINENCLDCFICVDGWKSPNEDIRRIGVYLHFVSSEFTLESMMIGLRTLEGKIYIVCSLMFSFLNKLKYFFFVFLHSQSIRRSTSAILLKRYVCFGKLFDKAKNSYNAPLPLLTSRLPWNMVL